MDSFKFHPFCCFFSFVYFRCAYNVNKERRTPMKKLIALFAALMLLCACAAPEAAAPAPEVTEADYQAWAEANGYVKAEDVAPAPAPAEEAEPEQWWDEEVEVLVVGAGGAGHAAAIEAATAGAQVLMIEKLDILGGVTFLSQGIMSGYETQFTKALDIHYTAEDCYQQQIKEAIYTIDPELTWITAEQCGPSIDWLADELGVKFTGVVNASIVYGPMELLHYVENGGQGFIEPFAKKLDELGVELRFGTKAVKLIGNEAHDEVIGVVAETADGEVVIKADAVVLCTGGYANNTDLIRRLNPRNDVYTGAGQAGCGGDAILMASEFGALIHNGDNVQCYMRDYDDVTKKVGSWTIRVGMDGKRFMNETLVTTTDNLAIMNAVRDRMHLDGTDFIWMINDQAAMDLFKPSRPEGYEYTVGETIEELAENMGIDPTALRETVDRWNELVEKGVDEDFGNFRGLYKIETGPFYAVKSKPGAVITYGGVARNAKAEVIKVNGDIIPGLYVAGEAAAAANANGWTVSHAITWGRIAGQNAGAYAVAK